MNWASSLMCASCMLNEASSAGCHKVMQVLLLMGAVSPA